MKSQFEIRDIYKFYGITTKFPITRAKLIGRRSDLLEWGMSTFYHARKLRPDFIYTRHVRVAQYAVASGQPFIYEIHRAFSNVHEARAFNIVKGSDLLVSIIAITHALKQYLVRIFNFEMPS